MGQSANKKLGAVEKEIKGKILDKTLETITTIDIKFPCQLPKYVEQQVKAFAASKKEEEGKKVKRDSLSNLLSITSAGSRVDALVRPTSTYVAETWGKEGSELLDLIDRCVKRKGNERTASITRKTDATVTVSDTEVTLNIKGAKKDFSKIIEQVCWTVCVAGDDKSIELLKDYNDKTNNGKTTRDTAATLFTEMPEIDKESDGSFTVKFRAAKPETHPRQETSVKRNECWKVMAGVAIVARGYPVPDRLKENCGLEGKLDVLGELFQRGCFEKPILFGLGAALGIPAVEGDKQDKLRTIKLVSAEEDALYWHFDAATDEPFEDIEDGLRYNEKYLTTKARHFVGWASGTKFVAAAQEAPGIVYRADDGLKKLPHHSLALTSFAMGVRLPKVLNFSASITMVKRDIVELDTSMSEHLITLRTKIRNYYYIFWDVKKERGYMVNGHKAAVILLKAHLRDINKLGNYDVRAQYKSTEDDIRDAASIERLLMKLELVKIPPTKPLKDDASSDKDKDKDKDKDSKNDKGELDLGLLLAGYYNILKLMREGQDDLYKPLGLSVEKYAEFRQRWNMRTFGWKAWDFSKGPDPQPYGKSFHKVLGTNPGLIGMARDLKASFLWVHELDPPIIPDGDFCQHFTELPEGQGYCSMELQDASDIINENAKAQTPDGRAAMFTKNFGWVHDTEAPPFSHTHRGDHLHDVDLTCFPVQTLRDTSAIGKALAKFRLAKNKATAKGKKEEQESKKPLRTWKEVSDMNLTDEADKDKGVDDRKPRQGMLVFGPKPDPELLRKLAKPIRKPRAEAPGEPSAGTRSRRSSVRSTGRGNGSDTGAEQPQPPGTPPPGLQKSPSIRSKKPAADPASPSGRVVRATGSVKSLRDAAGAGSPQPAPSKAQKGSGSNPTSSAEHSPDQEVKRKATNVSQSSDKSSSSKKKLGRQQQGTNAPGTMSSSIAASSQPTNPTHPVQDTMPQTAQPTLVQRPVGSSGRHDPDHKPPSSGGGGGGSHNHPGGSHNHPGGGHGPNDQ